MLTIQLPEEMEARLNVLADATNRPKSFYVREALERSLEDIDERILPEILSYLMRPTKIWQRLA
jgi:RHH-type rel operon transcriptional repressor/antitoxin RelB